ncbi:hypothetical protein [Streptomyces sp. Isolate_45]|uniref:hypothetical protein n=1 Tax=Streptomyces sp. Isolate_45 TaxID=2950111 RepID=UPI002481DB0A|nr:hypothetical protein [Streptomyces sp. Isolate_45]MDA5284757.1 hypothetical protein [Streptomyces sp. Isolate_45]
MQDFSKVPAAPVYSLVIHHGDGGGLVLTLDGQEIADGEDLAELREAGRDRLNVLAALAGRPIRARAVDPAAPIPWCMVVSPDGEAHDVGSHPAAPAPPPRPAHPPTLPPAPPRTGPPASLVPEAHRPEWWALWAAHAAGDLPTAVTRAYRLETALEAEHGPRHPYTITLLTARAWLTLCQDVDPAATAELLLTTAERRHTAGALPEVDTRRAARNAHALWSALVGTDPEAAGRLARRLEEVLGAVGEAGLAGHVRVRAAVLTSMS